MAFNRPSMPELVDRVATDIESRIPGADARLRRSNLSVLGRVLAAVAHGLYGFISWVARQVMLDSAEKEYLERWAAVWKITRTAAVPARGTVQFIGLDGVKIPAGTVVRRSDGMEYATTAAATIAAGLATVDVVSGTPGLESEAAINTRLTLAAQVMGVNATVTAFTALSGAADVESDDALRARLLERIQRPPQGGSEPDYATWAREVPGVTRVWVKPQWLGEGTVGVFFVRDNDASNIPDNTEIAAVQVYLDARRPVTAEVIALAPAVLLVNMNIAVVPDTPAVRQAVTAELKDVFRREAEPGGTLLISHLREAVSLSLGEVDHTINVPGGNVVAGPGQIPALGTITWL
ncbi:baseplate J/gp47 family protein [Stenotrophomonas sp. PS02298]|uniref:baseplate J/gp47 family protein n=1 Tax=Stenotrophomonas sp. PS02298 TaxID=2991424 RepID=UPI00249C42D2|nr:baseplate J/gp47 family protein [Stenotrophomonas sp. PS02298]